MKSIDYWRRQSKEFDGGETATFHTVRIDKLPSTLLVPEENQKQLIEDLAKKHASQVDVCIDACNDEADDRRATVLIRIAPQSTIDKFVEELCEMHISGFRPFAKLISPSSNGPSTSSSSLPPPPAIPVLINGSIVEPPQQPLHPHRHRHHQSGGMIPDLSQIKPSARDASRTLYVRNLPRKPDVEKLKTIFGAVATIIEIEVKNPESPSPYAFIQFPDVISVMNTIFHYYSPQNEEFGEKSLQKLRLNWGKTKLSSKLWIGEIPRNFSKDEIQAKIKACQEPIEFFMIQQDLKQLQYFGIENWQPKF
uniref:RRM domain-containing protein n=1 Tax=Panagrolaimus superbus TaxID=310955 RepID=A0A914Y9P9_9BILA